MSVILPGRSHLSEHESVDGGKEGGSVSRGLGGPVFCLFIFFVSIHSLIGGISIDFEFFVCSFGDDRA